MQSKIFIMAVFVWSGFAQMSASAYANEQRITVQVRNGTFYDVVAQIEKQSEFLFFYKNEEIDNNQRITLEAKNKLVSDILDELVGSRGLSYRIAGRHVIITKALPAKQQTARRISGRVTDTNGEPVIGANVVEKGAANGSITDLDGNFTLDISAGSSLTVSFIGYLTREINPGARTSLVIELQEDAQALEEVVVVGYGVQKKKLVTGATIQVSGENIQKINRTDVLGAMQGQTPGVNIVQASGQPGEGFKISIRGLGTIGDSEPLYVIDGVPGANIYNLSPSDIESIDVLKDAATAAIYGARAANGVVLVTTKQGKIGKPQLGYDGYYGLQNVYKMVAPLNAKEYMSIQNEARFNDGLPFLDFASLIPKQYQSVMSGEWNGSRWLEAIRNKNAPQQSHSLGLTGGTELSKYSLGFSYLSQEGILGKPAPSAFERYTARINSDYVVLKGPGFDVIRVGENLNYSYKTNSGIFAADIFSNDIRNMLLASPLIPLYNESGNYYDQADKLKDQWLLDNTAFNPVARMMYLRNRLNKSHELQANAFIEIQPAKDLKFKSSYNYLYDSYAYREYTPKYNLNGRLMSARDYVIQNAESGYSWTWDNTLAYILRLKEHVLDALIGQSLERRGYGESIGGMNFDTLFPGSFDHAWLGNTQNRDPNYMRLYGIPRTRETLASFFGRAIYNLKETYIASVSLRADGSSYFAKGKRWGYFPTASAGWILSNEPFMGFSKGMLDFLKIRASWGQNGNNKIAPFQYLATIAFDSAYGFGDDDDNYFTGAYGDIIPNPDIQWEKSEQINLGLDSRWLASRLGLTFDWYIKTTKDWLVQAPMLASYGTNPPYINGGNVENKGFEILLTWNDQTGDFSYGLSWNMARNTNKITKIANSEGIIHGSRSVLAEGAAEMYRAQVGYPIGYFYGYQTAGIFQNQEQINRTNVKLDNAQPGDVIFVDTNRDGVIGIDDKTMIGNPHPDITSGLSFTFGYKGFDLSLNAYGAFGHQIIRSYRDFEVYPLQNYTTDVFGRWHGEGTSNKLPRLTSGGHSNWWISDIFVEDADYVKLQNLAIGYDFKRLAPGLPLSQARLYVSAQNLFTLTGYSGMDPEVGSDGGWGQPWASGVDLGFYPNPRTYLLGLNLKF
jgi:TonB-linked SusC/RagA family outer membrane protein